VNSLLLPHIRPRIFTIKHLLAVVFLLLALAYLSTFPVFQVPLVIGAIIYVGILLWRPELWLLLLPILLPLLYLASWSGRVFLTEFDAIILLTLAAMLWSDRYTMPFKTMRMGARLLLIAYLLVYIAALLKGLLPLSTFDANSIANYYSNLNSLRVARGLLWALLLIPAWVAQRRMDSQAAQNLLITGLSLGAFLVFLLVLWERGVFYTLIFWTNKYAPIQALLNFSTEYRVTAMFAEMHTGGTAIDGYLLLVFPFTAMTFITARTPLAVGFFTMVFFGLLYACMTTFSRGVYLGIGVALLATALLILWHHRYKLSSANILSMALAFPLLITAGFIAFRSGGTIALAYSDIAFVATGAFAVFLAKGKGHYRLGSLVLFLLALLALSTWTISSKNYSFGSIPAVMLAVVTIVLSSISGYLLASRSQQFLSIRQISVSLVAAALLLGLLTPSLFGSRMENRFSTVKGDFMHRVEHWQTAIEIMDNDLLTTLFGQGLGQFPATYYWQYQKAKDVGGFSFQQEGGNQFLHYLGADDVRLGQRISLTPKTDYTLSLDARTNDKEALLYLRACHRQLINPTEWNPHCIQFSETIKSTHGRWKHLEFPINSGQLGSWKNLLRAPLVLTVSNRRHYRFNLIPQTIMDIDNISIRDSHGTEYVINGDFSAGIDNWFAYYDFNHMPWHIKNIWVHVYFETGLIGLLLFLGLIFYALSATARASQHNKFAFTIFVSLIGFLAVGSFGTLIDAPRSAFIFYLLLLIGLSFGDIGPRLGSKIPASADTHA
jgi:hypothetical protein